MITTEDSTIDAFFENLERCGEDDGMCLRKAPKIIRQDLFVSNSLFNGNFDYSSQESIAPKSLLVLLRIISEGTKINSESFHATKQAAQYMVQSVKFNSVKRQRRETKIRFCHTFPPQTNTSCIFRAYDSFQN